MAEVLTTPLFSSSNLKAYYKADDVSDSKGSSTLTNINSVTFTSAKYGNGFNFGSSNSDKYLIKDTDIGIAGNNNSSFSFWLKLLAEISSGTWTLLRHSSTSGSDRYIEIKYEYNSGTRRLVVDVSGTTYTYNITLGTTDIYNIIITKDVAGNSSHLFVNGSDVANGTLGSSTTGNNFIALGARETPSNYASVLIDDVACFDKVLNTSEIQTIINEYASFIFNLI